MSVIIFLSYIYNTLYIIYYIYIYYIYIYLIYILYISFIYILYISYIYRGKRRGLKLSNIQNSKFHFILLNLNSIFNTKVIMNNNIIYNKYHYI